MVDFDKNATNPLAANVTGITPKGCLSLPEQADCPETWAILTSTDGHRAWALRISSKAKPWCAADML